MEIRNVTDSSFRRYGKILKGYDCTRLVKEMEHTPLPEDVIYVPGAEELEVLPIAEEFRNRGYGGLPIQIGYCNGNNHALNALEYHRSSEINVAVTDLVLLLGRQQDIKADYTYDTALTEAFFLPAGTVVEVYATTLHYAPCNAVPNGFKCVVVLPKDTNTEITFSLKGKDDDKLMTAKNKWLVAHSDAAIEGAFNGLTGENIICTPEDVAQLK